MLILGIETSCDETAIALIEKNSKGVFVLSSAISSQIKLHAKWGGVVPNLAAREHLKNIIPVLNSALKEADKKITDVDLISVTRGPGLIPALLIGVNFAKTLAYLYKKPLLGVNHIEGHIYANWIREKSEIQNPKSEKIKKLQTTSSEQKTKVGIKFPVLALIVSGGHTQLILIKDHFKYKVIGETLDDAAGEAFDKVARILGLGYPGGPAIAAQAANHKLRIMNHESSLDDLNSNDEKSYKRNTKKPLFPRPMLHSQDFNFSFSGLKTSVLYYVKNYRTENNLSEETKLPKKFIQEMAYEFQEAANDILVIKTIKAAHKYKPKTIFLAGGVSANSDLREKLNKAIEKNTPHLNYLLQPITYSTDNAAMIAAAAAYRWQKMTPTQRKKTLTTWRTLNADAELKI